MKAELKALVNSCRFCAARLGKKYQYRAGLRPIEVLRLFQIVGVDVAGPISPITKLGNRYILIMVDKKSGLIKAAPMKSKSASFCGAEFILHWITQYGCPESIITDNDQGEFINNI